MKENATQDFKKVGGIMLVWWILYTILGIFWPFDGAKIAQESWPCVSLVFAGFFLGWAVGWTHFIWEPKK